MLEPLQSQASRELEDEFSSVFKIHTRTHTLIHTHRYLLKQFSQKLPMSQLSVNVAYLGSDFPVHKYCSVRTSGQFTDSHIQLEAYRQRARRWVGLVIM